MVLAIIVMTPLKAAQFAFEILAYYVWTGAQWIADKLNSTRQ